MLLQATEIHYDYNNKRVSAVGNVQIYHAGSTLEADKVIYDETTKRLQAEGNVRHDRARRPDHLCRRDGPERRFPRRLRRLAASRHRRQDPHGGGARRPLGGTFTVFHSGVYTACEPCKDDPKKPPLWQVKAARMIHDCNEKMIYFEDARLEFFGKPVAYMPYFSAPDPTVKRKSGFLMPVISQQLDQRLRRRDSVLLGACARLRLHVHAAADDQAGRAAARRIASAADRRRLLDPRQRHLSARQGRLPARRRHRPRRAIGISAAAIETTGQFAHQRQMDLGLGRHPADRQDVFPGLRPVDLPARHQHPAERPDRGRVAALSRRPRRPQLFRHARHLLLRLLRSRLAERRFRSSIRWSTTATSSASRCSAASSAIRST